MTKPSKAATKPMRSTRQQQDVGGSGTVPTERDTRAVEGDLEAEIHAGVTAAMVGPPPTSRQ
jgi:hypothetical protein